MTAVLQRTENMYYNFTYKKSTNPCGNCNSEVLEEWNFRFGIFILDPITDQSIGEESRDIPFYCPCINGFFSEKELIKFITDCILAIYNLDDEESAINQLLDKYDKYIDIDQINKRIIELVVDEHNFYFYHNKLKILRNIYENLVHVNLKPAKI
jgi:hypothetical protein